MNRQTGLEILAFVLQRKAMRDRMPIQEKGHYVPLASHPLRRGTGDTRRGLSRVRGKFSFDEALQYDAGPYNRDSNANGKDTSGRGQLAALVRSVQEYEPRQRTRTSGRRDAEQIPTCKEPRQARLDGVQALEKNRSGIRGRGPSSRTLEGLLGLRTRKRHEM